MILIESAIGAIIEMIIDAAWDRSKRQEAVIKLLGHLNLDPNNLPDDFESLYAYTLVQYGVCKPEPILNFFRNEFVREAFRRAFYEHDPAILKHEAEGIIEWNEEAGQLGHIDYNPRREFAAFSLVFNELVSWARTPAEVRRDQKLDAIIERLDLLPDRDQIRAELRKAAEAQHEPRPHEISWSSLLAACQSQVEHAVRAIGQKYIAELYVERERIEAEFASFLESDQSCFVIIGRSGKGKTNLLCHLANSYSSRFPVLLLSGRRRIQDESALIARIARNLPYAGPPEAPGCPKVDSFLETLRERQTVGIVLIDGISENEDIVLMKRALLELLTRYGDTHWLRIALTCRDTLWHRFSTAIPSHQVYDGTSSISDSHRVPTSASLGNWTDDEFERALTKYKQHFDIEFSLAPDAIRRCKYPLVLRLLCETHAGKTLGVINYLPANKVFREYLEKKAHEVADYFGLETDPQAIFSRLVELRAALWDAQDARSMAKSQILETLAATGSQTPIYTRLVDEGILFESESDSLTEPAVGFLFDALGDYLLYCHFIAHYSDDEHVTLSLVDRLLSSVHGESLEETARAERFLELIVRNMEDVDLQQRLLEQALQQDLYLFATCTDQTLSVPTLPDEPQEKAELFGERLLRWYECIVERYFPELGGSFDPYLSPESSEEQLGIDLFVSPEFREVEYCYRRRGARDERVKAKLTGEYPTFQLSFTRGAEQEFQLHDPEKGRFISLFRSFREVFRTLNFEHNLPFGGVALDAPARIAKYDVWNELSHLIDNHWLGEPLPLLHERTVSLIKELEREGIDVTAIRLTKAHRESVLSQFPEDSRRYAELSTKFGILDWNLRALDNKYDCSWLPQPDLDKDSGESVEVGWQGYSDDRMREYLSVLFSTFVRCYRLLVQGCFSSISHRMNLYQQWPLSLIVLVSPSKDRVRVSAAPETNEEETRLHVNLLPADSSPDIADGRIMADHGVPLEEYVKTTLLGTGRMTTSSHAIDVLLPADELLKNNPLNYLTYNWLKAELAEVLQIAFQFGSVLGSSSKGRTDLGV